MRKPLLVALVLIATPALAFDQAQVMQPAALSNVQSVHIAPVAVELPAARRAGARGDEPRPVAPRDAEAKAADLTAALRRGFEKEFTVVDAPGPGVLVVEATLTRLEASRPTMADYHREPGLGFESVYAGGAAVEVRLSRDGSDIAVLKDRYVGSFADGAPRIGVWQDTDRAFSRWSRQLPDWVAQPVTASR
ncbi:hypothetical protein GCM10028794_07220 [Silanimonas algicola]